MTKKVSQNVTNSNMKDLTEQLRQGKLPDNHHYYFQMPNGKYEVGNTFCLETLRWCKGGDKIKVLCEVPSYEEWFNQGDYVAFLEEENTKLKELLKEDKIQLNVKTQIITGFKKLLKRTRKYLSEQETPHNLIKSIDEVLGEE